jgi:hypothetical protein
MKTFLFDPDTNWSTAADDCYKKEPGCPAGLYSFRKP